jgi:hypothetical protein
MKQNVNFNFKTLSMFVFLDFCNNAIFKSSASFKDLSKYKIPWCHVDWCKFRIHLRISNVRHFGMAETKGLKIMASRSPLLAQPPYAWVGSTRRPLHRGHFLIIVRPCLIYSASSPTPLTKYSILHN